MDCFGLCGGGGGGGGEGGGGPPLSGSLVCPFSHETESRGTYYPTNVCLWWEISGSLAAKCSTFVCLQSGAEQVGFKGFKGFFSEHFH